MQRIADILTGSVLCSKVEMVESSGSHTLKAVPKGQCQQASFVGDSAQVTEQEWGQRLLEEGGPRAERCGIHHQLFFLKLLSGSSFINKADASECKVFSSTL